MNFFRNILIIVIIALMFSCEKDKDQNPPLIIISSPLENNRYQVLDNIALRATITDDVIIKYIQVSLIEDQSGQKVLSSLFYRPNQSTFELEATFPLDDSLLSTGRYYLKIEAQDEDNTAYGFQYIFINGIPKSMIGLALFTSSQSITNLYLTNSALEEVKIGTINEPYFGSVLNSYNQQLWFIPKSNENVLAYQLNERRFELDQNINSSFKEAYTDIDLNQNEVFVSTKEGELIRFNSNYNINYVYRPLDGRTFGALKVSDDYVAIEEFDINQENRFVNVLYRNTAQRLTGISIQYPCEAIYFLNRNNLILFQNDENGGRISELDILAGGKRKVIDFTDSILSVEQVNNNEYLIATKNSVNNYDFSSNQLLEFALFKNSIIRFDALNNYVYMASEKEIRIYQYQPKLLIQQITNFPENIVGMEIRYNK